MNRRFLFGAVVIVVAVVVIAALLWQPGAPSPGNAAQRVGQVTASAPSDGTAPAGAGSPTPPTAPAPTPLAAASPADARRGAVQPAPSSMAAGVAPLPAGTPSIQAAMVDLDKTQRMIRDYHTRMGENPVGTNAEIMKAIMGGNPKQATLGPAEGQRLNDKGELVDPWGTPYFFHQLSGDHMEIHSAGPDRIMGTDDDLVLK